jgi:hypothetical protein
MSAGVQLTFVSPPYYCTFVIDGPTLERKRPGSIWEPDDALTQRIREGIGLVGVDCETHQVAETVRALLDADGFEAGVDYGVINREAVLVPCTSVRFELVPHGRPTFFASTDCSPRRAPEHLREKWRSSEAARESSSFLVYSHAARLVGIDADTIQEASAAPTHVERVQRLLSAFNKLPDK